MLYAVCKVLSADFYLVTVGEREEVHLVSLPLSLLFLVSVSLFSFDLLVDHVVVALLVEADEGLLVPVECHLLHHLAQLGAFLHYAVDLVLQFLRLLLLSKLPVRLEHGFPGLDLEGKLLSMALSCAEEVNAEGIGHLALKGRRGLNRVTGLLARVISLPGVAAVQHLLIC